MGRGDDNILGPIFSANKKKRKSIVKRQESSDILFQPPKKQNSDLYSPNPTAAARQRAMEISADLRKGETLPFLKALDRDRDYRPGNSPALDDLFADLFQKQADAILKGYKLNKRSKDAKEERKTINAQGRDLLSAEIFSSLREDLPIGEQAEALKHKAQVDEGFIFELALKGEGGPIRGLVEDRIATSALEDLSEGTIDLLLKRNNPEGEKIFGTIIQRQAVAQMKRNLPYGVTLSSDLEYGILRSSRKGPNLLHLRDGNRTVCGKRGLKRYSVEYGAWGEGVRAGDYKRCPRCESSASEDLLMRVQSESPERAADILSLPRQEELVEIGADPKIRALVRKGLRNGLAPYEISEAVDHYLIRRVARLTSKAADEGGLKDRKGSVASYGGYHILWDSVPYDLRERLIKEGYSVPAFYRPREDQEDKNDDIFLLTTREEREQSLLYKIKASETVDHEKASAWLRKSEEIISRSIKRTLRNRRKEKSPDQLF